MGIEAVYTPALKTGVVKRMLHLKGVETTTRVQETVVVTAMVLLVTTREAVTAEMVKVPVVVQVVAVLSSLGPAAVALMQTEAVVLVVGQVTICRMTISTVLRTVLRRPLRLQAKTS